MKHMRKSVYILGINGSHGACAALLKDGLIVASALEERFNRIKNYQGYPEKAINYCLEYAGISSSDLDSVCVGFRNPSLFVRELGYIQTPTETFFAKIRPSLIRLTIFLIGRLPFLYDVYDAVSTRLYMGLFYRHFARKQKLFLANSLSVSLEKIHFIDHHSAHAYAAYYSSPIKYKKSLVVTCDGMGDEVSSRVFVVIADTWRQVAFTSRKYTLGWLYENITEYLGMKPREHESKVMGLAPYAHIGDVKKLLPLFEKLMWVDNLSIKSSIPMFSYRHFIEQHLQRVRFDVIAGAIQLLTERIVTRLISSAIKEHKIKQVMLGGGVFMNVKANMEIASLVNTDNLFVMPSAGDESTSIGACYFGYKQQSRQNSLEFVPQPLENLYLGPYFDSGSIGVTVKHFLKKYKYIRLEQLQNPSERIASLLAEGKIVARFAGRMEYGARALGNRSILADPSRKEVIRIINDQIKGRDFWMPFAPCILAERSTEYIINPKNIDSPFMMLAFHTTQLAREQLIACMHPYDYTVRPQLLTELQNPDYYNLIRAFESRTGIAAVLNTSFNLHGEPIVCTPDDALSTFVRSGLQYLLLEDYLLSKPI